MAPSTLGNVCVGKMAKQSLMLHFFCKRVNEASRIIRLYYILRMDHNDRIVALYSILYRAGQV
jgi:hypothetical protein